MLPNLNKFLLMQNFVKGLAKRIYRRMERLLKTRMWEYLG